jgi:hypothetical protein
MKEVFIQAIHTKNKISITFHSKEDGHTITRKCAPMDYGPSTRAHNKSDRFHSWDYESDKQNHTLSLLPNQTIEITVLNEKFDPKEFVTWPPKWIIARNWGAHS